MSQSPVLLIAASLLLLLTACGQSGDLVLPDRKPTPKATKATKPVPPVPAVQPPSPTAAPGGDAVPGPTEDPSQKKDGSVTQP
ncbi:MAG: hypothetical protein JWQ90_693 [Hydrocarboniphaga sp.]|uniref:LPS translocon maturation chaperone LptM n=1 Tax=Hydrocarboniphaga sp. TaxID=2033016 RepID=UPI00262A1A3B|nr:lipoprotein [Hydrocarboniphaga sp.]MDB5968243.1 hypothetical protein [Hydrocarboniphaga sp.]